MLIRHVASKASNGISDIEVIPLMPAVLPALRKRISGAPRAETTDAWRIRTASMFERSARKAWARAEDEPWVLWAAVTAARSESTVDWEALL